jgi:hypothetical protein
MSTAASLVLVVAAPATAATLVLRDPNESGTASDVRRVTVSHRYDAQGSAGRVRVVARVGNVLYGDRFDLWVDTPGSRRNYNATVYPEAGYDAIQRVVGWRTRGQDGCLDWEARSLAGRDRTVLISIPRRCLGNPDRVRIGFRAIYAFNQGTVRDWVPAARTFSRWVEVS